MNSKEINLSQNLIDKIYGSAFCLPGTFQVGRFPDGMVLPSMFPSITPKRTSKSIWKMKSADSVRVSNMRRCKETGVSCKIYNRGSLTCSDIYPLQNARRLRLSPDGCQSESFTHGSWLLTLISLQHETLSLITFFNFWPFIYPLGGLQLPLLGKPWSTMTHIRKYLLAD